jgi:hypothetical protein
MSHLVSAEAMSRLEAVVKEQPYPLLFATISGAHLYGFPSPDSDYDLRGVHVLPVQEVVGLTTGRETIELSTQDDQFELDLVSHDIKMFFTLLLKKNGLVLEQVFSPLVVYATPECDELRVLANGCVTKFHYHHYMGFAATQWKLFEKAPHRVKALLYVYRTLLTGIHLMRSGEVESNLVNLNRLAKISLIDDLVARKREGHEKVAIDDKWLDFYIADYQRLREELEHAHQASQLPDAPRVSRELNDLLVRVRMSYSQAKRA